MKLLVKDLAKYRYKQWMEQNKICPLCSKEIEVKEIVLDHDHDSGYCRAVLHRSCNASEGKIKKDFIRYVSGKGLSLIEFLDNLKNYLTKDYTNNPIHPTELTELEKELKNENKRLKSLKTESFITKCKSNIKELKIKIKEERIKNKWKE